MEIKCDYCGKLYPDVEEACPACGAPNPCRKTAEGIPTTIDELKAFAKKHKLPLDKMRFFIGEDFKQPKAFGIFKNEQGEFVVYKNKADGSRAVRYQGKDEAYAVNELYQKMRSEVQLQKEMRAKQNAPAQAPAAKSAGKHKKAYKEPFLDRVGDFLFFVFGKVTDLLPLFVIISIVAEIFFTFFGFLFFPREGYYDYQDRYYYHQGDSWYVYSDIIDDWQRTSIDEELENHYNDYYESAYYDSEYSASDFSSSSYYSSSSYDNGSDWDDDWDDDDWDVGGDWDSGFTDWDSDW